MELCCKTRITCEVSTSNPSRDDGDADFCSHFKTSCTVLNKLKKGFSKQINFLCILEILISFIW